MGNRQISDVTEKLGVSRFTVRRVLDHCGGVSSDVRQCILDIEPNTDITRRRKSSCDAYVIMPEIPAFFWSELFESIYKEFQKRNISTKYNIYSKIGDRETVENYLDEAERFGARCIIIAAEHDGLEERLSLLAKGRAVFSVCSQIKATNIFYFGSDHVSDGYIMARKCMGKLPNADCFLFIGEDADWRKGITEGLGENKKIVNIPCDHSVSSAQLARAIDTAYKKDQFDAVIGLDGISAKISMALKKCGFDIPIFCFEHQPIDDRWEKPVAEIIQDLPRTAFMVANAVEKFLNDNIYPDSKYNYIPSVYLSADEQNCRT